jgi:hypothetical protein
MDTGDLTPFFSTAVIFLGFSYAITFPIHESIPVRSHVKLLGENRIYMISSPGFSHRPHLLKSKSQLPRLVEGKVVKPSRQLSGRVQ